MSKEKSDYANCISLFPHNVLHTMYGLREIAVPVSRDYDVYFPSPPLFLLDSRANYHRVSTALEISQIKWLTAASRARCAIKRRVPGEKKKKKEEHSDVRYPEK